MTSEPNPLLCCYDFKEQLELIQYNTNNQGNHINHVTWFSTFYPQSLTSKYNLLELL